MSSHITSDIEKIADYIMLIHKGKLLFMENKDELLYNYGIIRCTGEQAELLPRELVVGKESTSFETSVLVRDINRIKEGTFFEEAERISTTRPMVDRANIEDVLLYIVKSGK